MSGPGFVIHDGKRYRVAESVDENGEPLLEDGKPVYGLALPGRGVAIYAFVDDCQPYAQSTRRRRWKREGYVLEDDGRTMTIRAERRSKRYVTSLAAIFSLTVKVHLANERAIKAMAKRRRG